MIIEKMDNEKLFGMSIFLFNTNLAVDFFIKLNKNNYRENLNFYTRVNRISIKVNYSDIEKTLIFFEQKDKDNDYVLLDKMSLKKYLNKGHAFIFNPIISPMDLYSQENIAKISNELSKLNDDDFLNPQSIDYKKNLLSYLRNVLKSKENEIIRFTEFNEKKE